jgi:hypothetical protein
MSYPNGQYGQVYICEKTIGHLIHGLATWNPLNLHLYVRCNPILMAKLEVQFEDEVEGKDFVHLHDYLYSHIFSMCRWSMTNGLIQASC